MSKLIYFMPMSLDGFIAGDNDSMDWSKPDKEVSLIINEVHRPIGTYLYGRKNYEIMTFWQAPDRSSGLPPENLDFADIWQAADKIVYSKSLEAVSTPKTRLERTFEPQAIRELKAQLPQDITISGPTIAGEAIRAGLVDEYKFLLAPVLLGKGKRTLPENALVNLTLLEERRIGAGWIYLHYAQG